MKVWNQFGEGRFDIVERFVRSILVECCFEEDDGVKWFMCGILGLEEREMSFGKISFLIQTNKNRIFDANIIKKKKMKDYFISY